MAENNNDNLSSVEIDYIKESKMAVLKDTPRFASAAIYIVIAVLVFAFIWAYYAITPTIAEGSGRIVPTSRVQVIQNLEGGIIEEIRVHEGQTIEKDQVVAILDDTQFSSAFKKDLAKAAVFEAEIARLTAQAEGKRKVTYPDILTKHHPELVTNSEKVFKAGLRRYETEIEILNESLELAREELSIIKPLARDGIMSRLDEIRLEKNVNSLVGKLHEVEDDYRKQARESLNKVRAEYTVLKENMGSTQDRMIRTVLRSPVKGVVNKVMVSSIDEVVGPGQKIMEIVPVDEKLTVIIRMDPKDIGFISVGQKAVVKVSAYNFSRYGGLDAIVDTISADALSTPEGVSYYEVRLKTESNRLTSGGKDLAIIPGMTVTGHIVTCEKNLLSYILKPFLAAKEQAFTEP